MATDIPPVPGSKTATSSIRSSSQNPTSAFPHEFCTAKGHKFYHRTNNCADKLTA